LFAIVYALEKFRFYLIRSKIVVFTNHAAIRYLLVKADSKTQLDSIVARNQFGNQG